MKKNMKSVIIVLGVTCLVSGTQVIPVLGEESFSYVDVSELEFCFSSGVGAWATFLRIDENGNFEGSYHDSDMGTIGEGYPNGTVYVCDFSGQFSELEKVNEYTYSSEIESIRLKEVPGITKITDGVQYVYSEPYGLDNAQRILFYLTGAPLERRRNWKRSFPAECFPNWNLTGFPENCICYGMRS